MQNALATQLEGAFEELDRRLDRAETFILQLEKRASDTHPRARAHVFRRSSGDGRFVDGASDATRRLDFAAAPEDRAVDRYVAAAKPIRR